MEKIIGKIKHFRLNSWLASKGAFNWMSDEAYLRMRFQKRLGRKLNLENPRTYNEKLQWLKLYDRRPEYSVLVDKYEVKKYVADRIGERYIIPTLGVWNTFEEIDFDSLPDQFVLKCTHDSGGVVICRDKKVFDRVAARKILRNALKKNYYYSGREWPYKAVKPQIIAEQYMEDREADSHAKKVNSLIEYKVFCFNGKAKMVLVCKGRAHGSGRTNDFCDINLVRLPFTSLNPNSTGELVKPKQLPELISAAETLAAGIPQVRADFYLCNGTVYFGELTLFHNSGLCKFHPEEWDGILGSWIQLPQKGKT